MGVGTGVFHGASSESMAFRGGGNVTAPCALAVAAALARTIPRIIMADRTLVLEEYSKVAGANEVSLSA